MMMGSNSQAFSKIQTITNEEFSWLTPDKPHMRQVVPPAPPPGEEEEESAQDSDEGGIAIQKGAGRSLLIFWVLKGKSHMHDKCVCSIETNSSSPIPDFLFRYAISLNADSVGSTGKPTIWKFERSPWTCLGPQPCSFACWIRSSFSAERRMEMNWGNHHRNASLHAADLLMRIASLLTSCELEIVCGQSLTLSGIVYQLAPPSPQNKDGSNVERLKFPGWDGSWTGDYTTCSSCHLAHAARSAHAPCLLQRYARWVFRTN